MASAVETPSGKGAGDENFPVASRLIARPLRPHVQAFYAFARTADDIADNPDLEPADKLARLDRLGAALTDDTAEEPTVASNLRRSLTESAVSPQHALDLLEAFKQDAVKNRYADWAELMAYCRLSAAPVGRYLLELHGEPRAARPYSDALCAALQILNHLQDCVDDYRKLDRVYLPQTWLADAGLEAEALANPKAHPDLRHVLDRCLAGVRGLLPAAVALPQHLTDRRLAMEAGAIAALARSLHTRLERQDPLTRRVALSKPAKLVVAARGALSAHLAQRRDTPAAAPVQGAG